MKLSEQWLREWINPPLSRVELSEQLTMAGLEVDAITPVARSFAGVVVGQIVHTEVHPARENLRICHVNVGDVEPLTVVCGAPNARIGLRAPLAMSGAVLPDEITIQVNDILDVASQGMLCSASELGLEEGISSGLMELPPDTRVGEDVYLYLGLDDVSIELGITPNRGDCLSLAGIARELGALNRCAVHSPDITPVASVIPDILPVTVTAPDACPHYVGRVIRGIDRSAQTPLWLRERLRRSGMRCISPVVDVTNYVMLELGQPMHAFDLAKLAGGIHVRRAFDGESITLLDGQNVRLNEKTLVIADEQQSHAIAGIMGGQDGAIDANTQDLFLESAYFAPRPLAGHARSYGLHTESSFRFERGVDPGLQVRAMERATALLLDIVGGQAGPLIEVSQPMHLSEIPPITLRAERIRRLLGIDIPPDEVADILTRLGMRLEQRGECWEVRPPSFRFDIAIEADLIEEVARVHGYHRLPTTRPRARLIMQTGSETTISLDKLRSALVHRGYQEAITYSFVDPKLQTLINPDCLPIALANPISSEMSVMRTSLWCGLAQAVAYNQKRQQARPRFFESGLNFIWQGSDIRQERFLAGIVSGDAYPQQWGMPAWAVDFFDVKADVEILLGLSADLSIFTFSPEIHPALHQGQSARIRRDGQEVGWMGALHPSVARQFDLNPPVYVFELRLDAIDYSPLPSAREISKFPAIRRDLAISVAHGTSAQAVRDCLTEGAGAFLESLQLFDVYEGKGVEPGKKSLALGLTLQAPSRTLTDQEVDALIQRVIDKLSTDLGATLRK